MTASYYLAVDVGSSRTAAATARLAPDGSLLATGFPLGRASDTAPTAMYAAGAELLFGDAAERRGLVEPERLVRDIRRRIGDDVPIIAGDRHFRAEEVFALTVAWVVDRVSEREARLPSAIAVTVPASWSGYRRRLVEEALTRYGWGSVVLVAEPEAAGRHYASQAPLEPGQALAVYDLGGGGFDAAVLRKDATGEVRTVGPGAARDDVGGVDFDDLVVRYAIAAAGVDARTATNRKLAVTTLRRECVDAKEALSFDSETVIPVLLGGMHHGVRLTRGEFEGLIEPLVERTVDALDDAITASGVDPRELRSIVLTGGSSRIPLVAQLLSERFDLPIAVDTDPKAVVVLGAVRVLSDRAAAAAHAETTDPETVAEVEPAPSERRHASGDRGARHGARRRWRIPALAWILLLAAVSGVGIAVAGATAVADGGAPPTGVGTPRGVGAEALAGVVGIERWTGNPPPSTAAPDADPPSTGSDDRRADRRTDREPRASARTPAPAAPRDIPITTLPVIGGGPTASGADTGATAPGGGAAAPDPAPAPGTADPTTDPTDVPDATPPAEGSGSDPAPGDGADPAPADGSGPTGADPAPADGSGTDPGSPPADDGARPAPDPAPSDGPV